MDSVRPKKHLGQHFLTENSIADRIASALTFHNNTRRVLEVGPGTGILTKALLNTHSESLKCIEIDSESIPYLVKHFPAIKDHILHADFLQIQLESVFDGQKFVLCGNFPYNISSQILFRVVEHVDLIPEVVGMFQKEVARRITSAEGSKEYGILSVLLQVFYHSEYLFTVNEGSFNPPPKVKSGVLRLRRNERGTLPVPHSFFKGMVKTAFGQRRKTLRNSLAPYLRDAKRAPGDSVLALRPEQLSPQGFIDLAVVLYPGANSGH